MIWISIWAKWQYGAKVIKHFYFFFLELLMTNYFRLLEIAFELSIFVSRLLHKKGKKNNNSCGWIITIANVGIIMKDCHRDKNRKCFVVLPRPVRRGKNDCSLFSRSNENFFHRKCFFSISKSTYVYSCSIISIKQKCLPNKWQSQCFCLFSCIAQKFWNVSFSFWWTWKFVEIQHYAWIKFKINSMQILCVFT